MFLTKGEKTYLFFGGCLAFRESVYKKVLAVILAIMLFVERYCFLTMVYKTKCTNYCLLILVVFINTLLLLIGKCKRGQKVTNKMHELFSLEMVDEAPPIAIIFVGILDMLYAFCLFWPANLIPAPVILLLMQLSIPINTLLGRYAFKHEEYKRHIVISLIIMGGALFGGIGSLLYSYETEPFFDTFGGQLWYLGLFAFGQFMNSLSTLIKEKMVRSILLNQDEFRFKVGLAQFFAGLFIMVFALDNIRQDKNMWEQCSHLQNEPDFKGLIDFKNKKYPSVGIFMKVYIRLGFSNIFNFSIRPEESRWVFAYILLYCFTQIWIQRII